VFFPNGNDDRPHHGATLLALREAGTAAADVVLDKAGHDSKWK
jgi:hypothetical protein